MAQCNDIIYVHVIDSTATIDVDKAIELCAKFDGAPIKKGLPRDGCFLTDLIDNHRDVEKQCDKCKGIIDEYSLFCKFCGNKIDQRETSFYIHDMNWCGYSALDSFKSVFIKHVVPHIKGQISGIIITGDIDNIDDAVAKSKLIGFTIVDGKYAEQNVVLTNK